MTAGASSARLASRPVALGVAGAVAALGYDPSAPAAVPKRALLLAFGLGALALWGPWPGRPTRRVGAPRPPALVLSRAGACWLGLGAWAQVSSLWAQPRDSSLLHTWVGACAVILAAGALSDEGRRSAARLAAVLIGAGSGLACLVQAAAGACGIALHGLHGNSNWLGLVLACALPLQIEWAWRQRGRGRWAGAFGLAVCLLCAAGLGLAGSRTAWLALAGAALLCLPGRSRWLAVAPLAAMAFVPASDGLARAWAGRAWIWGASWRAALDAQPLGCGLGAFARAYLDAQGEMLAGLPPERAAVTFTNATTAHNDWIESAVSGGLPALALLAASFALAIRDAWRPWRAGAACVLTAAVCALGDSPLHQPAVVALLGLVLPACGGGGQPVARRSGGGLVRGVWGGCLVVAAVLLPGATRGWLGWRELGAARDAGLAARGQLLAAAARIDPASGHAALQHGLDLLERGEPERALAELRRSDTLLANLGTPVAMGNALMALGRPERAALAYRRALRWHPAHWRAHGNLAEALAAMGDLDAAERHLGLARRLQPGHPKLARIAEELRRARIERETRP
ncbi:MAG: tetratricopeptide repeat protein [Deltaproteobacteria bacterium]|nr:tetratricopeptide repeat protein [Deltaproteobacteria bacterium]